MGKLLVDVLSTEDRGLIGFTENGEEISLSAPNAKCCVEKDMELIIKNSSDNLYFHFKKEEYPLVACRENFLAYNFYTERK